MFHALRKIFDVIKNCASRHSREILTFVNMADEALAKAGLHFDELNKIRVLEPEVAQQTTELKEECKDFLDSKCVEIHAMNL